MELTDDDGAAFFHAELRVCSAAIADRDHDSRARRAAHRPPRRFSRRCRAETYRPAHDPPRPCPHSCRGRVTGPGAETRLFPGSPGPPRAPPGPRGALLGTLPRPAEDINRRHVRPPARAMAAAGHEIGEADFIDLAQV